MTKGDMFIDEEITLDFPMTDEFRRFINGLDKAFEENDKIKWEYYHEVIGEFAKNEHNVGNLTSDQMHMVWERYGTAG